MLARQTKTFVYALINYLEERILNGMKVLMTGASGFVGTHLTQHLLDHGLDVHVLVRADQKKFPSSVIQHLGDINDLDSIKKAAKDCSGIFHLAGLVGYSKNQRQQMNAVNIEGTKNIIRTMQDLKISKLLHFSSVVAVGASYDQKPLNEESEYNISNLNLGYFETKREAEKLVFAASKKGDFDCVCVNPSTIYGYGDAQKGSRKIHIKVAQGKFPIYPPGGANIISIEDVVAATFKAWHVGRPGERYILSGENLYIKDIFKNIAEFAGVEPPRLGLTKSIVLTLGLIGDIYEKLGKRSPINSETAWTSVLYHWFDNSKAKKELQLNPRPARAAIEQSVLWMKDMGLLKK